MCKNFFLSPRSGICSECLFSPPSASGAPRLCRPVPQGSRSQACRVGRAAPSGSAPGSRPSRRPAVPLGWPEPQRDTPWGSEASCRAVRPQSRFRLPEVSAFPHPRCSKPVRTAERLARVQPGTGARRAARSRGGLRRRSRASLCLPGASLVPRCRAAFPAPSHPLCWVLAERFVSNACVNWRSAEVSLCGRCLAFAGRLMHTRTSRPPPAALRVFAVRERRPGSERVSARPWASVWNEEHLAPRARPAARLGRRLFQSRRRCWLQNKDSGPLPPFLPCGSLLCL